MNRMECTDDDDPEGHHHQQTFTNVVVENASQPNTSAIEVVRTTGSSTNSAITDVVATTPPQPGSNAPEAFTAFSSSSNTNSFVSLYHTPVTPTTLLPVTSIKVPSSADDDGNQTCASSVTLRFQDAELFVSSLYPSAGDIDEAQGDDEEPSFTEPVAGGSSGMMGSPHKETSAAEASGSKKDERKNTTKHQREQDASDLQQSTATSFVTLGASEDQGQGSLTSLEYQIAKGNSIVKTEEDTLSRRTEFPGRKTTVEQPPLTSPVSPDGNAGRGTTCTENFKAYHHNLVSEAFKENTGNNNNNDIGLAGAAVGVMPPLSSHQSDNIFSRMMALPGSAVPTEVVPTGPGAHPIANPIRMYFISQSGNTTDGVGGVVSQEDSESNVNDMGLAEAEPVDALPQAQEVVQEEMKEQQQKHKGRESLWGFLTNLAWYWRYLLVMLPVAIMALWFLFITKGLVGTQDPAKARIRQSIEEVFGKDYFDSKLKEKALHWIAHEDPLQNLAVKQEGEVADTAPLIQRFSLAAFYFQTSAVHPWNYCSPPAGKEQDVCFVENYRGTRWLSAAHECQWGGVYCEGGSNTVSSLRLTKNNLAGPIPSELSKLSNLKGLHLFENKLSGSIPAWLGQLTSIKHLALHQNTFTGRIPSELFSIGSLAFISLTSNLLTGHLPSQLGLFGGQQLYLDQNLLTGPIPEETNYLTNLLHFQLAQNGITGTISTLVGQLTQVKRLYLDHLHLNQSIPSQVGLLENLERLQVSMTSLEGTIPEEVYNLKSMIVLDISDTKVGGTISSRIGQLSKLQECNLANTKISGTIPRHISQLSRLRVFHANGNPKLTGAVPLKFCANRLQHHDIVVDCSPSSSTEGFPSVLCPKSCCSSCCDVETKICLEQ